MNDEFIEGFIKAAVDKGYDDDAIATLFKVAMEDSEIVQMINSAFNKNKD